MAAATYALRIEQGATWRLKFTWCRAGAVNPDGTIAAGDPIDLTGCTARMQIRKSLRQPVLAFITTPVTAIATDAVTGVETTTETPNGITLGGVDGTIVLELSADKTALLNITAGVYDLEIVFPSGDVYRVLEGTVTVDPNVTRPDLDGTGTATVGVVA